MELLKAKRKDIDDILNIHNRVFDFRYSFDNYVYEVDLDIADFMILKVDRRIVGYFIIHYLFEQIDLVIIAVDKVYQNKGYGQYMMDYIYKLQNKKKCSEILIEVNSKNSKAINFYLKNCFRKIDIRKNYYGNNEDAIILKRG